MARILLVDDDPDFRAGLAETLADFGHRTVEADSGARALAELAAAASAAAADPAAAFDLVLLDLRMRGIDGLETLRRLRADHPASHDLPVVMLTAHADGANTIEAMKLGAFDHLTKPISRQQVQAVLARVLDRPRPGAGRPADRSADGSGPGAADDRLLGASPGMHAVHKLIGLAAPTDATVLIAGETGTGKEEVARALHRHGPRARRPFVAVNCAAIPAELLESELFGHVRGAFTGALGPRVGRFQEAEGGTLFLDEIGDMPLTMQAKILRVLQDRTLTPVGASAPVTVNVRIVAATHRDLIGMVREGAFREDLFYRLNVVRIDLPPLRERGADVLVLAEHFLRGLTTDGAPRRLSPGAAQALLAHPWPGNVRELRNVLQRAVITVRGPFLEAADLAPSLTSGPAPTAGAGAGAGAPAVESLEALLALPWAEATSRLERLLIDRALRAAAGNRAEAARRLGIHRQLLYAKLKEFGLGEERE